MIDASYGWIDHQWRSLMMMIALIDRDATPMREQRCPFFWAMV